LQNARTIHGVSFDGTANIDLTEVIQDTVGAMVSSNTESNITVTYEDSDGTLDFSVTGGGSVSEAFKTISVSGQDDVVADSATDTLTLVAGSNMTITTNASGDTITFASSGGGGSQNLFSTIAVSGQSNVVADSTTDTLTLVAGSNITLTTDASSDSITIASSASGSGNSVGNAFTKNTFTGDGSTTAFTLSISASNEDNLLVFIDGVYQADNVYTVSGTTLTFATAPVNSRVIEVFTVEAGIVGSAPVINTMTGDGSDTTLALSTTPTSENQTFVTIDGVVQHKDTYAVSGSTLTFSAAPPTGTKVECITFTNVAVTTFQDADGDTKIQVEESSDEDTIRFDTAGTERMVITSGGDIAINSSTADPLGLSFTGTGLTINENSGTAFMQLDSSNGSRIEFGQSGSRNFSLFSDASNFTEFKRTTNHPMVFSTNNTERMRLDGSGNLGIGTTNGDATNDGVSSRTYVSILGSGNRGVLNLGTTASAGADGGKLSFVNGSNVTGEISCDPDSGSATHGNLAFNTANAQRMKITSSGEVVIGKTNAFTTGSDNDGSGSLHVANSITALYLMRQGSNGGIASFIRGGTTNPVGNISVTTTGTTFNTSSDYRLKENVNYEFDALSRVAQLKPARFNFIANADTTVDGFLAHEVSDIVPEAITGEKDGEEMQSIDQSKLVPLLTKAIQEQQTQIEVLQSEINTLKGGE